MIEVADYEVARASVGMVERSKRGKLRLLGADAAEFLQGQLTNDVEALAPGTGCYAALLDHKGKVRTDMRVLRGVDWIWLDTEPGFHDLLARTVATYGIGRDVRAEDQTSSHSILALIGPRAPSALEVAPPDREHSFVEGEHGVYVRTLAGVDVICDAEREGSVRASIGAEPLPDEVAECLRIEAGRPRFGADFDAGTLPEEAGLNERAVSFTKGCYVGQETVARLHYKGKPNRHLRGLKLSGDARTGDELRLGDRTVGVLGSTADSPTFGPIGLAVVRREAGPGDVVEVGEAGVRAEVVELPFGA